VYRKICSQKINSFYVWLAIREFNSQIWRLVLSFLYRNSGTQYRTSVCLQRLSLRELHISITDISLK
jgi:hypothetical protein